MNPSDTLRRALLAAGCTITFANPRTMLLSVPSDSFAAIVAAAGRHGMTACLVSTVPGTRLAKVLRVVLTFQEGIE